MYFKSLPPGGRGVELHLSELAITLDEFVYCSPKEKKIETRLGR